MIIYILLIAVIVFISVYPTMWAAKKCGAQNHSFFSCLIAIIIGTVLTIFLALGINSYVIVTLISLIAMAISLKICLSTKIFQSLIIAIMSWGISFTLMLIISLVIGQSIESIINMPL